jgi:ankyrin repeat protein
VIGWNSYRRLCGCVIAVSFAVAVVAATGDQPLVQAAKRNDVAAVRALLKQRADANATEGDGATAIHWAAYHGNVEMLSLLIGGGAKADAANDLAITPLAIAADNAHAPIVERLLELGANPNAASETGVTPLMRAARTGSTAAVRALLAKNADVNATERERQQTPLMWAVSQRHPEIVKLLLERGADVRARTAVRRLTVMLDQGPPGVKTAKEHAHQIEAGGSTALLFAASSGEVESARALLDRGADVNDAAADGNSALVLAAFAGNGSVARLLLERGADPNAAGAGYAALHAAVLRGDGETVKALLAKGANPNARLTKGSPVRRFGSQWALTNAWTGATPLFVATVYLEMDLMRMLLAAGASPSLALANGTPPLLVAAGGEVAHEVRPSDVARLGIQDSDTPEIPRPESDLVAASQLLLDHGASVSDVNAAGDTALHAAATAALPGVIQLLVNRGAVLDATNKAGQTPLALTLPRETRGSRRPDAAERAARAKAAENLLRTLGATR